MLQRNIKQSLTALEVFNKLEEKIYKEEVSIISIYDTSPNCIIYNKVGTVINIRNKNDSIIDIVLYKDGELEIRNSRLTKSYMQILSDEEYEDVKKRFLKIAQKYQDDFENWVKDVDDINEIDKSLIEYLKK